MGHRIWMGIVAGLVAAMPANAAWQEASSPHFLIYSEESPASLASYAERLERFDAALRRLYPVTDIGSLDRLTIYALRNANAVRRVMGARGSGVAGVYRGRAAGSLALTSRDVSGGEGGDWTQLVLLHEYAHHFMLQNFAFAFPTWYVEGFAEFVSTARFNKDGSVGVGLPAQHRARELGMQGVIPLRRILADDLKGARGDDMAYVYGIGWALTHYLLLGDKRKGQLVTYLKAINAGTPAGEAAQAAFGDPKLLQRELDAYISHRMTYVSLPATELKVGKVTVRAVSPAENAIMPVRIESKFGVSREEAMRLVPQARAAAAPFPKDEAAQCALAEAEFDAGNMDQAVAAADRVLDKRPGSYCALVYKGMVLLGRVAGRKAPPADPAWAEARGMILRANRAETDQALPLVLFYDSYRAAHVAPSRNAVTGLLAAAESVPQDASLQYIAAAQLLRDRNEDAARKVLGRVANNAHSGSPELVASVYQRIGKVDAVTLADELENAGKKEAAEGDTPSP